MSPFLPDLDAYFERIGYGGPAEASLAALNAIVRCHVQSVPFENLDVLLGRGISLSPDAIEEKLIRRRRGGYCFEQNSHLLAVLQALEFSVTPLSARVRWQRSRSETPPRTHLCLRVELEGRSYLVDVGVGGLSPTSAVPLELDQAFATPHEPQRLVAEGDWEGLRLRGPEARLFRQVQLVGEWHDLYELTLEPMPEIDREAANWFTSAHPRSHFRGRLMVARATPTGRCTLVDRELTRRETSGAVEVRRLSSWSDLLTALEAEFGLTVPPDTRFDCPGLAGLSE